MTKAWGGMSAIDSILGEKGIVPCQKLSYECRAHRKQSL